MAFPAVFHPEFDAKFFALKREVRVELTSKSRMLELTGRSWADRKWTR